MKFIFVFWLIVPCPKSAWLALALIVPESIICPPLMMFGFRIDPPLRVRFESMSPIAIVPESLIFALIAAFFVDESRPVMCRSDPAIIVGVMVPGPPLGSDPTRFIFPASSHGVLFGRLTVSAPPVDDPICNIPGLFMLMTPSNLLSPPYSTEFALIVRFL